jgi:hypothetical protein
MKIVHITKRSNFLSLNVVYAEIAIGISNSVL